MSDSSTTHIIGNQRNRKLYWIIQSPRLERITGKDEKGHNNEDATQERDNNQ